MATAPRIPGERTVAEVDALVDENGARIDVPDGSPIKVAGEHDENVGSTGPTSWWLYGLIALGIVVVILVVLQIFNGAPGSDVQPGTPVAAPVVEPAVPTP